MSSGSAISVVDYDEAWPQRFESLSSLIGAAVGEIALSIEHVGSTAVPGLAAKPIIDIDVVVLDQDVGVGIARLAAAGYEHEGEAGVPGREAFRRPPDSPAHHLYLCRSTSLALANHLAIRDCLRANPPVAQAYGDLKKRLALEFAHDRAGYVEAKSAFLLAVLREVGFDPGALESIEHINRRPG